MTSHPPPDLLADLPPSSAEEHFDTLLSAPGVRIERIVSHGHASPPGFWYDQAEDEWVLVVSGAAKIRFEDSPELLSLTPGNYLHISAGRRHRVDWTDPTTHTVWLAVHFRSGQNKPDAAAHGQLD